MWVCGGEAAFSRSKIYLATPTRSSTPLQKKAKQSSPPLSSPRHRSAFCSFFVIYEGAAVERDVGERECVVERCGGWRLFLLKIFRTPPVADRTNARSNREPPKGGFEQLLHT